MEGIAFQVSTERTLIMKGTICPTDLLRESRRNNSGYWETDAKISLKGLLLLTAGSMGQSCRSADLQRLRTWNTPAPVQCRDGWGPGLKCSTWKLPCYAQSPLPTLPICSLKIGQSLEDSWINYTIQRKQTQTLKNWYKNAITCFPPDLCTVKPTGQKCPYMNFPISFLVCQLLLKKSPGKYKMK